jgi:hypothetical protein
MSSLISHNDILIRINPKQAGKLEYSRNDGRSWGHRYGPSSTTGDFEDLKSNGKEILAVTSKGLFYSTSEGRAWARRSR